MYVVLINEAFREDADALLPQRVKPFNQASIPIPFSCFGKIDIIKASIAHVSKGLNITSPLWFHIIDTVNQGDLVAWLLAWKREPLRFDLGKFWFDDVNDFTNWLDKIGAMVEPMAPIEENARRIKELVDRWRT